MNSKVSVVIPTYNSAAYLPAAVDSALNQTVPPSEVVVVDDGSTDETAEVLKPYRARVRYILQENKGPAAARNRGIEAANGDLVAFLDADDLWFPRKLEVQLEELTRNPALGLVHSDFLLLDTETGTESPSRHNAGDFVGECYLKFFARNGVQITTAVARKECLTKVGGFDERIRRPSAEDYDLAFRFARHF
jgi:glycosyltransferase involved in cell wall biosynthesis